MASTAVQPRAQRKRAVARWRSRAVLGGCAVLWVLGLTQAWAANPCAADAQWLASPAQRHFMVLAAQSDVFYDGTGPAFVMLLKVTPEQADIGALGMYADAAREPRFGAVPAGTYEAFMREPDSVANVMLRLEITGPQFERVLGVLRSWERRVREAALLYSEIALDNILLVKQATEELNRCGPTITPYQLDWGLQDEISEHNSPRRIPYEYFKTLKGLNATRHVPDAAMPPALLATPAASPHFSQGGSALHRQHHDH